MNQLYVIEYSFTKDLRGKQEAIRGSVPIESDSEESAISKLWDDIEKWDKSEKSNKQAAVTEVKDVKERNRA